MGTSRETEGHIIGYPGSMKELSPAEAAPLLAQGALLVDVREPDEYTEIHAQGAQLLPLSELETRYQELPQGRPLLLICRSGARSARAAEWLEARGYSDVTNVTGGTLGWQEAGLPTAGGQQ